MADLRTRYLGLALRNPLVASSSSPLTGTLDGLKRLEAAGAGAVVLPSLFEEDLAEEARQVDRRARRPRAQAADYNAGVDEATASPHRPGQDGPAAPDAEPSGAAGRPAGGTSAARQFTLRDGTRILVRPIMPQDKQALREGFARLSAQSRYRRFLTSLEQLSDRQLRDLTEIDYADHMAWVAVDPSRPAGPGMGVARYVRLPEEPTAAEAAVTVLDEYQGRGIGTILLQMLASSARANGIRSFHGYVLAENAPMMEILHGLGARVARQGPLLGVDVPIPATADELPDTPTGRVFKLVASGELPPFRLRYPGTRDP